MGSSSEEAPFSLHRSARIDGLRAFAALAVLFIHSSIVGANSWVVPLFGAGFIGVHLFFLISGYVINLAWDAQGDGDKTTFYIRRVFRVAPLYYVMLALSYIMLWANNNRDLDLTNLLLHLPMLHGFSSYYRLVGIGPMWSLTSELMFYLLFPLLVTMRTRTLVIIFVLSFAFLNNTNEIAHQVFDLPWLAPEPLETLKFFIAGMLIWRHRDVFSRESIVRLSGIMAWMFTAALAMITLYHLLDRAGVPSVAGILKEFKNVWAMHEYYLIFAFPYLVFSQSPRMQAIFDNRVASFLGMISYSLYLWQMPIVFEMLKHTSFVFPVSQIVLLVATIAVSTISYFVIERPFIAFGRKLSSNRPRSDAAPLAPAVDVLPTPQRASSL